MKKLIVFPALVAVLFYNGCGAIGLMGTPSQYERKIPAEYDLAKQKGQKILVLVEQPAWLGAEMNLRYYLTEAMRKSLTANVKVQPEYIVSYDELSEFRSKKVAFSSLSPAAAGKALGADIVLLVTIQNYQLSEVVDSGYYNGFLDAQAALFETATGEKLWPKLEERKSIRVGFETGKKGQEAAVGRLVNACAYCTTRYLYNCPKYKFKIFDEIRDVGWEE